MLTMVQMICAVEIKGRKRTVLVVWFMVKYSLSGDFPEVSFVLFPAQSS